jgi:hypothetical protein
MRSRDTVPATGTRERGTGATGEGEHDGKAREGEAPAIWASDGPGVSDDGRERNGRTSGHWATSGKTGNSKIFIA